MANFSPELHINTSPQSENLSTPEAAAAKVLTYGEMLHVEAIVKQIEKEETLKSESERRAQQELASCTFSPSISDAAKSLPSRTPLSKRFKEELEERKHRLQQLQLTIENEESKELTFTPKTNAHKVSKQRSSFLQEQEKLEGERVKKINDLKQQLEESSPFSPQISMYSQALHREEPVYDRLFSLSKLKEEQHDELIDKSSGNPLFKPQTNKNYSPEIPRTPSQLYQDALRRREDAERRMKDEASVMFVQPPKISDESRKMVMRRLIRMIKSEFVEISPQTLALRRTELSKVLRNLYFFKQSPTLVDRNHESQFLDRLFSTLPVSSRDLIGLDLFLRFVATCLKWNSTEFFEEMIDLVENLDFSSDDVYITPIDGQESTFDELKKEFYQLNSIRLAFAKSDKPTVDLQEGTFKPSINPKSIKLDRSNQVQSRPERLLSELKKKEERAAALRREKEQKELSQCTFKPSISKINGETIKRIRSSKYQDTFEYLYSTAKTKSTVKHVRPSNEKELEECTFQPNLNKIPVKTTKNHLSNRSQAALEATVNRLRKANEQRNERQKQENEPGYNDETWSRRNRQVKPFKFATEARSSARELNQPLLFMDVALGNGRTGRLAVHEGDDPDELALRFAQVYHLDDVLTQRLSLLVKEQLINLHIESPNRSRVQNDVDVVEGHGEFTDSD
ncbi:hypothetical protein RCL1_001097 [Eukaryota sp. TZLM3-RCL]